MLNDLFDTDGNLFVERKISGYLFFTNQVISSVRNYLEELRFQLYPNKITLLVCPLYLCNILKAVKGCRTIYNGLVTNTHIPNSIKKRQNEINFILDFQWFRILNLPFKITKDSSLRWLQLRINQRILSINYLLSKMNLSDT